MKNINIFVAGSKDLDEYRDLLVVEANKINFNNRSNQQEVQINFCSYKEVGDEQNGYNEYIADKSDIVIFLIEGKIGDKTKQEYRKAIESPKCPLVWFFVNENNKDSETTSFLEGALGEKYPSTFKNKEELVSKIKGKIDKYVEDLPNESQGDHYKVKMFGICSFVFAIGVILGLLILNKVKPANVERSPMLLIAGGGSVANYIKEQPEISISNLADYPNGFYMHLPTKSAWKMLVEEVVSLQDTRRYYPICISAAEATDSDFCSAHISKQMFLDSAIIVSVKLGEDSLAVYIQKNCSFLSSHPECEYNKSISVELLKQIVSQKEMNIFSTSIESGTRSGYCGILGIDNSHLDDYLAGQFSENSPLSAISVGNKPYLLLGSKYYQMRATLNDAVRLIVQTDYVKPMMIYFMAYRVAGDTYKIPKETISFLSDLKVHTLDDYISPDGSIKIKNHNHVIYDELNLFENTSK